MKKGSSGLTVEEYADKIEMNQSAVSHQLRILKHSGLVRSRREGKRTFYSLDDHHIELILKLGIEHKQEG